MKTKMKWWWATAWLACLTACGEVEHHPRVGELEITLPWSREVPPAAPVAAGYLSIRNRGNADDRLVAVRSGAADRVEIHEIRHEGGIARMRELAHGLPLPAGTTVELKPGGYHLMFITPGNGFVAGNRLQATLVFAGAGEITVEFQVRPVSATSAPAHAHH